MNIDVTNNLSARQFETEVEGHQAIIRYTLSGQTISMTHTEVPEALGGKGVGSQLARFALDYAQAEGLLVVPICPFIAAYIEKHPEYQALVSGV
jgi:uncharacterized protein